MSNFQSTKFIELGSCAFRQPEATHSHCAKLHGYQLKAKFWFGCNELDNKNWAVDFGGLKELKLLLQNQFDHTTCIAANDPLLPIFQQLHDAGGCDLRIMEKGVGIERTAEYCFEVADAYVRKLTNDRCWVEQVEVFEHELNSAIYSMQDTQTAQQTTVSLTTETQPAPATTSITNSEVIVNKPQSSSRPANVGPNVSSGKGDWFAGTTWA